MTWENGEVDGTFEVVDSLLARFGICASNTLSEEDHGASWSSKRLVGCGGDNIGVLERRWNHTSGDQTGNMSHVNHEVGADLVSDLSHAGVIDQAAVGGGASDDDLRSVHEGILLKAVVIDDTSFEVDSVREGLEVG